MTDRRRIVVFAGSSRRASANRTLAEFVAAALVDRGRDASTLDLGDYEMPLYNGDAEERDGAPEAAHRLKDAFEAADGLIIASPEYNGAMTPLLKNSIDWVSRVDRSVLNGKLVGLMATTPGRRGGTHGLGIVRQWLRYLGVELATHDFSLPSYNHVVRLDGDTATLDDESTAALATFIDRYLAEFDAAADDPVS